MPHTDHDIAVRTAPYVPFTTFLSALDRLAPKPPDVIDRGLFDSFSGAVQSQVVVTLRFLYLIDRQGRASSDLYKLVEQPESRAELLQKLLKGAYAQVFELDLKRASAKQLDGIIEQYNVSGATHRKAVSFFIKASQFAGIELSAFITARKGRATRRKNGTRNKVVQGQSDEPGEQARGAEANPAHKTSRTLQLQTGNAEITLCICFDPFTTSDPDRQYIFDFIDKMNAYGKTRASTGSQQERDSNTKPKNDVDDVL